MKIFIIMFVVLCGVNVGMCAGGGFLDLADVYEAIKVTQSVPASGQAPKEDRSDAGGKGNADPKGVYTMRFGFGFFGGDVVTMNYPKNYDELPLRTSLEMLEKTVTVDIKPNNPKSKQ